jgi:hypothetical protein
MTTGVVALAGCSLAVVSAVVLAEGPDIRRGDAKAYHILRETKHLPKLDRGDAERTLAIVNWQPVPRPADDPARAEPAPRLQILDATCDADLVVIARVESSVPFQHPNGRWVLTTHDLAVSRVVRAHAPKMARIGRVRYVHPSGELTVAGRAVRTTLTRFPTLATDDEALFFLVGIGGGAFRTSLLLPPMALRNGVLDPFGTVPTDGAREPAAGLGALEAVRAAAAAVCRPAPVERSWQSGTSDGRLPPFSGPPPP